MKATLWLADYAKVSDSKVDLFGGGWSNVIARGPLSFFVAGTIECPWDRTNEKHTVRLDLVDADGQPVSLDDERTVRIEMEFEIGRPPGATAGQPQVLPFAFPFGPLDLAPGRYQITLSINGQTEDTWYVAFTVLAPQQSVA